MTFHKIKWKENADGDLEGHGEHATYVIHQLREKRTGVPDKLGKFLIARRLGQNPLKVCGGPYDTVELAKERAQGLELCL